MANKYSGRIVVIVIVGVLVGWGINVARHLMLPAKRYTNQEITWWQVKFEKHLIVVLREGNNVRFVSDGFFGVDNKGVWKKSFIIPVGEKFYSQPDQHASAEFIVEGIDKDGVEVKYRSRSDHRSFGKNEVSFDQGKIKILWKSS